MEAKYQIQKRVPFTVASRFSVNRFFRAHTMMKLGSFMFPQYPVPAFLPIWMPWKPVEE